MAYTSRLSDDQVYFNSGSGVNADDIPESSTRIWVTTGVQSFPGAKTFNEDLIVSGSLFVHNDISLGPQGEGDTRYIYYDGGSAYFQFQAGSPALATFSGHLGTFRSFFVNVNSAGFEDCNIYFGNIINDRKLYWDSAVDKFRFNENTIVEGNLQTTGDAYVNAEGPAGDSFLYFYENTATGASLKWDNTDNRFEFSHTLNIPASGSVFNTIAITDTLDVQNNLITNVATPINDTHAVNKAYVDALHGSGSVGLTSNTTISSTSATYGNGTQLLALTLGAGTWAITYCVNTVAQNGGSAGEHGGTFWLEDGTQYISASSTRISRYDAASAFNYMNGTHMTIATFSGSTTVTLEAAKFNSSIFLAGGTAPTSIGRRTCLLATKIG